MKSKKRSYVKVLRSLCKLVLFAMIVFVFMILAVKACQAEDEALKAKAAPTVETLKADNKEAAMWESKMEEQKEEPCEETPVIDTTALKTVEPKNTYFDVPLSEDLQDYIMNLCEEYGIDPAIVIAMIQKESCFTASAIGDGGNSFGLMQIQPYWHSERMNKLGCTDLLDPYQNVTVGIDLLAYLINHYDGAVEKALTAYNQGYYAGTVTNYAWSVMSIAEDLRGE